MGSLSLFKAASRGNLQLRDASEAIASMACTAMYKRLTPQELDGLGIAAKNIYQAALDMRECTLAPVDPFKAFVWSVQDRKRPLPEPPKLTRPLSQSLPPLQPLCVSLSICL